ncbi:TIM barrel protein [Pseudomonas sp. BP8]|uniref:sugar phosphate isomerase/epimerase family protein n=1 Tax=Pseudomonas sp. BP8 TaxID=2817864 RepID=UPI001AE9819A|nr:TIM barrel protein [Pseudomonas sp. BP8]HDS1737953.1 sugar phosphate isomerase/epimerase [Pseudomonas putida]
MKGLGVAHLTALDLEPVTLVRQAGRAGFASVGLRLHPVMDGALAYPMAVGSQVLRDLKAVMAWEGVRVSDIEFVSLTPEVDVAGSEPLLASGAELGAVSLTVSGDDAQTTRLSHNFAALCELAGRYGLRVDLEFMRWRQVGTLQQALAVLAAAGQGNSSVLVDALHLYRSGGDASAIAQVDPRHLRAVQLCDAPLLAPAEALIIQEAREGRLLPGQGALPLAQLLAVMPSDVAVSVEIPSSRLQGEERLQAAYAVTRDWMDRAGVSGF